MAHIDPPSHLRDYRRFQLFELGLEVGETTYPIRRTGDERVFTLWARFRGRFVIPRLKQVTEYDNTEALEQDVQTWLNSLMGRKNTTDIPLVEPTLRLPKDAAGNDLPWNPVIGTPVISDPYMNLDINESGTNPAGKSIGDVMHIGTPKRLYQLTKVTGNVWSFTPSVLPRGTSFEPAPSTSLKVRVLTQSSQSRSKAGRGGWDIEVVEVVA